ncbi:ribosomal RNA small subunit methyltransferase A [candidate division WOR-1 bacterium RIFOXYB2_FULL_42_35]|uniref:Ribosomal RNA small subunit methyltransferase A n=1 Tax=candidate division WOR-1 bacterium RIFOXYC2_FULL_41_25 TaxID=1802586 RepID=A0A1F4TLV6_UNCSA|nr:MAG: ribosomal RNA small subunit methyltransferase A [candidate division WOR-1 bacterium RIFOXYA2_FULL_41_14]OGC23723.1 MAG: ribosomal RNA small subunit methyltransferase A [candidate division WOR-1 bacterium RIFOXYB2_FULL_42_35]OGC33676.1 MAG: ribosomal RNA small subunit methyltransferase A [candidate division WOR-1 bacterium RIFOXYC2_FULL_41_25]
MNPTLAEVTRQLLQVYGRYPRKRLGQHFLTDPQVVQRIIQAAELSKDDLLVEIGSGLGVVTTELAKAAYQVIAIEIDKELLRISRDILKDFNNVSFVGQDILKTDLHELVLGRRYKIIGNLPYYITAPIVEQILKAADKPEVAVIMVQKEVAERMVATPGTKKYGSFSIFTQFYAEVEINSFVSKSSFHPWPEVGSAVVTLKPHKTPKYKVKDEKLFFDIMHAAFQQRRKMLRSPLSEYNLEEAGLDLTRRPETLSIEEFIKLAGAAKP